MSEYVDDPAPVASPSTDRYVVASIMVVASGVLLYALILTETGRAAATVGFVLAEAIALYVGYGALVRVVSCRPIR